MIFQLVTVSASTPSVPGAVGPIFALGPNVKVGVSAPVVSVKVVGCVPLKLDDCACAPEGSSTPRAATTEAKESAMRATLRRNWARSRPSASTERDLVVEKEPRGG